MSLLRLPRKLGATRSLVAVAMLAGAAFSAVPAQAATVSSANTALQVQLTAPDAASLNQPANYALTLTNNTTSTINNAIVGVKFGTGARLTSGITGLPANSCVRSVHCRAELVCAEVRTIRLALAPCIFGRATRTLSTESTARTNRRQSVEACPQAASEC